MERADQKQILAHENIDSRREIHQLLERLSPARRIKFAAWACSQAVLPNTEVRPVVAPKTRRLAERARWDSEADRQLSLEVYWDCWFLCSSYKFNLDKALARLVEMVRNR